MIKAEQGDILRIQGIGWPVIVVSNDRFNAIGEVIVCPILNNLSQNAIHLPVSVSAASGKIEGVIACEQIRHLDLNVRRYQKLGSIFLDDFLDLSDTLIALFEYR